MDIEMGAEGLDSRLALKLYRYGCFVTALWCFGWGVGKPQPSWANALGFFGGTVLFVAAGAASFVATLDDPFDRRNGLRALAFAHLLVFCAIVGAYRALVHQIPADAVAAIAFCATVGVWYASVTMEGDPPWLTAQPTKLFGNTTSDPARRARSRFRLQMRQVAALEERARFARDLHDSVKQQLFVIQTSAAAAEARLPTDAAGSAVALAQVRQGAREVLVEIDAMMDRLHAAPLSNDGLVDALRQQADALRFRAGVDVAVTIGTLPNAELLPPGAQEALFRVAQEALANAGRHAHAQHVWVTLDSAPGAVYLQVADDGVGYDAEQAKAGMGIRNMRERAEELGGAFTSSARAGGGVVIRVSLQVTSASIADLREKTVLSASGLAVLVGLFAWLIPRGLSPFVIPVALAPALNLLRYGSAWIRLRRLGLTA